MASFTLGQEHQDKQRSDTVQFLRDLMVQIEAGSVELLSLELRTDRIENAGDFPQAPMVSTNRITISWKERSGELCIDMNS